MSEKEQHIKHYTAEDIQRYLDKQMTPAEMHAFEKASLEDPFLAEALEGYMDNPVASVPADINELKKRLDAKDEPVRVIPLYKKIGWVAAAAIFILLGAAGTWLWLKPASENSIAQKKVREEQTIRQQERSPAAAPVLHDSLPPEQSPQTKASPTPIAEAPQPSAAKAHPPASAQQKDIATPADTEAKPETHHDIASVQSKNIPHEEKETVVKRAGQIQETDKLKDNAIVSNSERASGKENAAPSLPAYIYKGKITDEQNNPLPFVNINIPGTATYAYTDANGNFTLMNGDTQLVVHVKSVGFQPELFTLHSNTPSNNISLKTTKNNLADIVVAGYGKQDKKKLTGKPEKADDDEIAAEPADGWGNYDIYLLNNERITPQGYNALKGSVELSFVVNQYGNLSAFHIIRSSCPACEKEAIRLLKEGPKWKLLKGNTPAKVEVTLHF